MDQRPPVPTGATDPGDTADQVVADPDRQGPNLAPCPHEYVTVELVRVTYGADDYTWAVQNRLYPQVRALIRQTLDQLREELRALDPALIVTSVND